MRPNSVAPDLTVRIAVEIVTELLRLALYDGAMEHLFVYPPHEEFLKGQTVIGKTLKHRW